MELHTTTGVLLTVERYNDLLEGERGLWEVMNAWRLLLAALRTIQSGDALNADELRRIAANAVKADLYSINLSR